MALNLTALGLSPLGSKILMQYHREILIADRFALSGVTDD